MNILLTLQEAEAIRQSARIAGTIKQEMRRFLDATADAHGPDPEVMVFDLPENLLWKHYVARQADYEKIIGGGITRVQLTFIPNVRDPNRKDDQLRLDYTFENADGLRTQLHPGKRSKCAQPVFIQMW